jgi:putative DNA primase/helicase
MKRSTAWRCLEEVITDCKRHVWMKLSEYRAVTLMLMMSYLSDVVEILPILLITSPEPECGKSTLAEWFSNLSNKPIDCSNISSAAVYRVIQDRCPTLVLDEMDKFLDADEVLRSVFNSGHKRKFAYVIRMTGKNLDVPAKFSTWCPKLLAMIKLPPRTIISRSVHVRLTRKGGDVKTKKLRAKHYDESHLLRRKLARFANQIRHKVREFRIPEDAGMINRASDNWEPLLGIAQQISQDCYSKALDSAKKMSSKDAKEMKSLGVELLEAIERIIVPILETWSKANPNATPRARKRADLFISTQDLLDELNKEEESTWSTFKNGLTGHRLRKELHGYDEVKKARRKNVHGYLVFSLDEAVKKWVPKPEPEQEQEQSESDQSDWSESDSETDQSEPDFDPESDSSEGSEPDQSGPDSDPF